MNKIDPIPIVVTGIGAITPIGSDIETITKNLKQGVSGIRYIDNDLFSNSRVRHAGIVIDEYFNGSEQDESHRATRLLMYAAKAAFINAKINQFDPNRLGMFIGTDPPIADLATNLGMLDSKLSISLHPSLMLSKLSRKINFHGVSACHIGACSASAQAIAEAMLVLRSGQADIMLAGGTSSRIEPLFMMQRYVLGTLAETDADPTTLSKPFDKNRKGFTLAEASILLVLERLPDALARNSRPLAYLSGYGSSLDGYSITDPDPNAMGMTLAMRRSLDMSNLKAEDIDYINAHANSNKKMDRLETEAIKQVFLDQAYHVAISSTKSTHGHILCATAAMEALVSIISIQKQFIPPTMNYQESDPDCDLDYTPNHSKTKTINHVLSNSFGFGGQNCSLIFSKFNQ